MSRREDNLAKLREAVTVLRSARRPWPDRWLVVAGSIVAPLGVALIVFGWYGSAQTTLEWEQTPYLISGGLLGLALVVIGVALYFGYWVTRLVRSHQETAARDAVHQQRVEESLAVIAVALASPSRTRGTATDLVVTEGGTMLHRIDCVATRGQAVSKPKSRAGLELCGLCRPTPTPTRTRSRA